MAEAEELVINATSVTSWDMDHLNALRQNKLDREVHMSHNQKKERHLPKKNKMLQKQGKP